MYLLSQAPTADDLTGYAWIKLSAEFSFAEFTSLARKLEAALELADSKGLAVSFPCDLIDIAK